MEVMGEAMEVVKEESQVDTEHLEKEARAARKEDASHRTEEERRSHLTTEVEERREVLTSLAQFSDSRRPCLELSRASREE